MDTLKFDLVTPDAIFFSGQANQVDVPGADGEFGVLPGHAPLISAVKDGVVRVYTGKDAIRRLFVSGGIAEVRPEACSVLSERVLDLDSMTRADAERELARAESALDMAMEDTAKEDAIRALELAKAVLAEF